MKRILPILIFTIVTSMLPGIENNQRVIPLRDDLVLWMKALFAEQGLAIPFTSGPWTEDEARMYLRRIESERLSSSGQTLFYAIEKALDDNPDYEDPAGLAVNAGIDAAVEGYMHLDQDFLEWNYGDAQRNSLLNIPIEFWILNNGFGYIEINARKDPFTVTKDNTNYTNIMTQAEEFYTLFPYRGFLGFGGEHWKFQFGRDDVAWGNGQTGNLLVGDSVDYREYALFSTYFDSFKFSTLLLSLEPWEADYDSSGYQSVVFSNYNKMERFKMMLAHRFEMKLFELANFSFSEAIIYGGKYPDMKILNPLMFIHNWYEEEYINSFVSLELEVTPIPYVSVYGEWGLDQTQSAYEIEKDGADAIPQAFGFQAGIEGFLPMEEGLLSGVFEWTHTDPWFYLKEHPILAFTSAPRIKSHYSGRQIVTSPIGYTYGPDAIAWLLRVQYQIPYKWTAGFNTLYLIHGENGITSLLTHGQDIAKMKTPSGANPEHKVSVSVDGEYHFFDFLSAGGDLAYIFVYNDNYVAEKTVNDIQLALFVSCKL